MIQEPRKKHLSTVYPFKAMNTTAERQRVVKLVASINGGKTGSAAHTALGDDMRASFKQDGKIASWLVETMKLVFPRKNLFDKITS